MDDDSYLSKFLQGLTEIGSILLVAISQTTNCIEKTAYTAKESAFHFYDSLTNNFESQGSQGPNLWQKNDASMFGHIERQSTTSSTIII